MSKNNYKLKCEKLMMKNNLLKKLLNIKFDRIQSGGGRFKCEPTNDFKDICKEDNKNGKYKFQIKYRESINETVNGINTNKLRVFVVAQGLIDFIPTNITSTIN